MTTPAFTHYPLTNTGCNDAHKANRNLSDIVDWLTDGTFDLTVGSLTATSATVGYLQFDTTPPTVADTEGMLIWNAVDGTLNLGMSGGDISLQIGQEMFVKVENRSGVPITNGSAVYISGRTGQWPEVTLARSDVESTSRVLGIATQDIADNSDGYITTVGYVRRIKTNYSGSGTWGTTWAAGDRLYLSKTNAGVLTNVEPSAPHHSDVIGSVGIVHGTLGSILVTIDRHKTLEELSDVDGTPLTATGQFPVWNQTAGYFDFNHNISEFVTGTGSGATNRIAYWSSASAITSTASMTWDGTKLISPLAVDIDIYRFGFLTNYAGTQETTIAFDGTNTFTLAPTGTTWSYYRNGIKYTITGSKTVTLSASPPASAGLYYIYINATDGTLTASTVGWTLEDTYVPVATVAWNNALTPKYWMADERHTVAIDRRYHWEHHFSDGTEVVTAAALTGPTVSPTTPTAADNTLAISQAVISDEDLKGVLSALSNPNATDTKYVVMYRSGGGWAWVKSARPFIAGTDRIQFDSSGTMTDGTDNKFVNYYLLLTNMGSGADTAARFVFIPGQAEYASAAAAQAENFSSLTRTGLPINEYVAVYQFTYKCHKYTGDAEHGRLEVAPKAITYSASSAGVGTTMPWGGLTGTLSNQADLWAQLGLYVKQDGTTPLTAAWDVGSFQIRAETLYADVSTGTAPLTITSTTLVSNLNVQYLNSKAETAFLLADGTRGLTGNWNIGNYNLGLNATATYRLNVAGYSYFNGNVSIGTLPSETNSLFCYAASTNQSYTTMRNEITATDSTTAERYYYAAVNDAQRTITAASASGYITGLYNLSYRRGSTNTGNFGGKIIACDTVVGHHSDINASAITSDAIGLQILPWAYAGTITNFRCIYINAPAGSGTVTNKWSIYDDTGWAAYFKGDIYTVARVSFTPTLTVSGGTAPVYSQTECFYKKIGNTVFAWYCFNGDGGAEGAGANAINFTLPVNAHSNFYTSISHSVGSGSFYDTSQGYRQFDVWINAAGTCIGLCPANNDYLRGDDQNETSRNIKFSIVYEAA